MIFSLLGLILSLSNAVFAELPETCDRITNKTDFPAQTQKVSMDENCFLFGETLYVEGRIGHRVFKTLNENPQIQALSLHSPGGSTGVAERIGELVRERGLTTWMRPHAICASSCTLVFQAGIKRYAGPEGLLFYHCTGTGPFVRMILERECGPNYEAYTGQCLQDLTDFIEVTTDSTKRYMQQNHLVYGMDQEFYDYFFSEKAFDERWFEKANFCQQKVSLGVQDALRFNIVQQIDESPGDL